MLARRKAATSEPSEIRSTLTVDGKVKLAGIVVSVVIYKLSLLGLLIGFWSDTKTNQAVFDEKLTTIQKKVERIENLFLVGPGEGKHPQNPDAVAKKE